MNIPFSSDMTLCIVAFFAIMLLVGFFHLLTVRVGFSSFLARKGLHLGAILICARVIGVVSDRNFLGWIFFCCFFVLCYVAAKRLLFEQGRTSYGIAFFSLAFALLLWSDLPRDVVVYAALVTAVCDPLAGIAGEYLTDKKSVFLFEKKSWMGFFTFYGSGTMLSLAFFQGHPSFVWFALLPAITELYSWKGCDNLTVPLTAAFWAQVMNTTIISEDIDLFLVILGVASFLIIRRRWLQAEALPAALGMALVLLFAASWEWLCLLGVFFIAGSFSSKISGLKDGVTGRNAHQVFANGGIALACSVLYFFTHEPAWMMSFLVSVATSLADTWSSDLGILAGQQPRDILSRKPVTKGLSGGVTLAGTGFGLAGASLIGLVASALLQVSGVEVGIVISLGTLGMLTDSVLGSVLQAKFTDDQGVIYEQESDGRQLARGFRRMNNDAVNLLANGLITTIAFLCFTFVL